MAETGIRSTDLNSADALDELIGNQTIDGVKRTRRVPVPDFVDMLLGTSALTYALPQTASTLALIGDSWMPDIDDIGNSMRYQAQAALDLRDGPGIWNVNNTKAVGGTALGTGLVNPTLGAPFFWDQINAYLVAYGDPSAGFVFGTGLNDLSLGRSAEEMIYNADRLASLCIDRDIPFRFLDVPPFKDQTIGDGSVRSFYVVYSSPGVIDPVATAAKYDELMEKRALYVAHLNAAYPGQVIATHPLVGDPSNPGALNPVHAFDPYHIKASGKAVIMNYMVNEMDFPTRWVDFKTVRPTTSGLIQDQSVTKDSALRVGTLELGQHDGAVGLLNLRQRSPFGIFPDTRPYIWMGQPNAANAGMGIFQLVSGNAEFRWFNTEQFIRRLVIAATGNHQSFAGMDFFDDTRPGRFATKTFGGGVGAALDVVPKAAYAGTTLASYGTGGGSLAQLDALCSEFGIDRTTGNPTLLFRRAGTAVAAMLDDGLNTIIADPGITTGVYLAHGATSWAALSDASLKTNVEATSAEAALGRLMALEIVDYDLLRNPDAGRQRGVIAQQAQAIYPALVQPVPGMTFTDTGDPLDPNDDTVRPLFGFAYSSQVIIADLIATVQLLNARLAHLEGER